MERKTHAIQLQDKEISFELTDLAEQANGNVLVRIGDTVALVTAVMSRQENLNQGFFPLTVDYEERYYAAGRILGSRFIRREGRPTEEAVITARFIDRAIRPLFPKELKGEVQVIVTCLSWDGQNDPDIAGLLGTSLILSLSDIPWNGPLGAVRVGRINGQFIINPTYEQREQSEIDFVLAGAKEKDDILLNMIEAESQEAKEEVFIEALEFAKPFLRQLIEFQQELHKKFGQVKASLRGVPRDPVIAKEIHSFLGARLEKALFQGDRRTRMQAVDALKRELAQFLQQQRPEHIPLGEELFEESVDRLVHEAAFTQERRADDRKLNEIRSMEAQAGVLPRTHGSGLFIRGQTKTLSILTLGAPGDQKLMEGMEIIGKKRFMHHYNFPPYAPGEVKPLRGPGRREIGHGMLVEKALLAVIPNFEEFPYTMRIVSEVLSSNGSTSMAATCSSSLALMDAGVPIIRPVAGISIGLMQDERGSAKLLTDIQGPEDHHGDMDFKIAGTTQGITAIQLDVKIKGIGTKIFSEALAAAKEARHHILDNVMAKELASPRPELSKWAPRVFSLQINPEKIGLLIGPGGKTINKIIQEHHVEIDVEDTGRVFITALNGNGAEAALDYIKNLTKEIQVGEMFQGRVKRIMDFGAFVEIPGGQEGLVHISQLAPHRVNKVQDVVKTGDVIPVKVIEIDEQGRINLSLKEALQPQAAQSRQYPGAHEGGEHKKH